MTTERAAPDAAEIRRALAALFAPEDVVELRAILKKGIKNFVDAGYFDGEHRDELAAIAAKLNKAGKATYVTMNPVAPELLGRYFNRVEQGAKPVTGDDNIIRRRWLLINVDPGQLKEPPQNNVDVCRASVRGAIV